MMRSSLSLWLLSQLWSGHAFVITQPPDFQLPTPTITGRGIKAVVPTTAGEIGINPVLSDLGDAETYVGQIFGTDTQYINIVDTTTQVFPEKLL
jgi:hypothetical protein